MWVNPNRFKQILLVSPRFTWFHRRHIPDSLVGESKQIQTDSMWIIQIHILIQSHSIILSLNHILVLDFNLIVFNIISNVNSIDIRYIRFGFRQHIQIPNFQAEFSRTGGLIKISSDVIVFLNSYALVFSFNR